ncbi:MAG TPA: ribosomal RNA small subunit methyltransferase A [Phycisphaerales bacterium]|nr:ribosomal RNA small subunit methyltransferase A [Phycisphaerales bacterium]
MQTKQDIERLLAGAGLSPNRRLGQNFLIDLNLMRILAEAAHLTDQDVALEVGTGTGSLTEELASRAGYVITVEYDTGLARLAASRLAAFDNVSVLQGDALESKNALNTEMLAAIESARSQYAGRLVLASNLPYSVGSVVMANLMVGPVTADAMVVTVQKEVADRMAATPGHDEYGTLSILMTATGRVHLLRKLPASVFWPRPQVESAMIVFERDPKKAAQIHDMATFRQVITLFMGHRRKMLKACVKFAEGALAHIRHWPTIFEEAFVDPHHRPEELTAADYINIANLCYEQTK